jgi:predicted Zn-dependent protease
VKALFGRLADAVVAAARPGEWLGATLAGEDSEFVRFNRGRLRQAGRVERAVARLRIVRDGRQATCDWTLPALDTGPDALRAALADVVGSLRAALADSEPDPLLEALPDVATGEDDTTVDAPDAAGVSGSAFDRDAFVASVVEAAGDADLVGFAAAGGIARGFCSSAGSRQWFRRPRLAFDWSIHLPPDTTAGGARKAVKDQWSGPVFDGSALRAAIARSRAQAVALARPVHRLAPGEYRAWLEPAAVAEFAQLLGWGGFSARAHLGGQSPLARLQRGDAQLSPLVSIAEDLDAGFAPAFNDNGHARPRRVPLVEAGRFAGWLVSPRSAREFGLVSTAASEAEAPESFAMAPGTLPPAQAAARLGSGVWVSNLWYLNWSDRAAGRATGMTRFASLWVEEGEPVGPIEAMRFDDSLFAVLGERLEALGDHAVAFPSTETYEMRAASGCCVPGALLAGLRFAL